MFRLDFQRPFDILLNFKALQNEADGKKENKRRGSSGKIPERPLLSGFLNEVRTFFEQKFLNLAEKPQKE